MEFHDLLHGHIRFASHGDAAALLSELINSPEINRLRNMRQMNFDVPLIQELGRSRRLPHSIGVAHIASNLAKKARLSPDEEKVLIAAAILHDAAIPPYGHLVESELKNSPQGFKHEKRVEGLIRGTISDANQYMTPVGRKSLQVAVILDKFGVDIESVIKTICPDEGEKSPISAQFDLDNIDNVHRMAAMLGWPGAKDNLTHILSAIHLRGLKEMVFTSDVRPALQNWLDFRQKIYTMIIAHPECIPYNALQTDLVRIAIDEEIVTPDYWWVNEPEFEEKLRNNPRAHALAEQLLSGCEYHTVDYVWFKNFKSTAKLNNARIVSQIESEVEVPPDYGYFVWNEKGLISREVNVLIDGSAETFGNDSASCMIALVKKSAGRGRRDKGTSMQWRRNISETFSRLFNVREFEADFPESYTGDFLKYKTNEIKFFGG